MLVFHYGNMFLKRSNKNLTCLILLVSCIFVLAVFLKGLGTAQTLNLQTITGTYDETEAVSKRRFQEKLTQQRSQGARIFVNQDGEIVIPEDDLLQLLDTKDLREIYHRYVETIQVRCRKQIHLGNELDGGYHICEDSGVAPIEPCLVYSFGIRRDFSFDDSIARTFGCEVHSFDPGDGQPDHRHSANVWFHEVGISDYNDDDINSKRKIRTLGTIRRAFGDDERQLDILKIDTEGAEWSSLAEMVRTGSINDVRQLLVEFHVLTPFLNLTSRNDYISHLTLLRDLYQLGFRIFYFRQWNLPSPPLPFRDSEGIFRTGCHEVHFMRVVHRTGY